MRETHAQCVRLGRSVSYSDIVMADATLNYNFKPVQPGQSEGKA